MAGVGGRKSFLGVLAVVSLFWASILRAEPVSLSRVQKAAEVFLQGRAAPRDEGAKDSIRVQGSGPVAEGFREVRCDDGALLAYVADLEPRGFVALSADTDIAPVIAYSFRTSFPSAQDRANPLARLLREDMRLRRKVLEEHPELRSPETARQWDLLAAGQADSAGGQPFQQWPPEGTTSTGGWLETAWHQDAPFNAFCPLDPSDGLRSYVGCVATALAQVIHYHRLCDINFSNKDSYVPYSGMKIDADHVLYDFPSFVELNGYLDTIRLKYAEQIDLNDADVAALSFACGVAVEMNYSSDGSGATSYAMQRALLDGFRYHSADMYGWLTTEGLIALQENMINGLPALLSFSPPDGWGGHLVVCDGYNTDGEYHLNFGWGAAHPQEITEAWYRLPTAFLYRDAVISECVLNIQPIRPVLEVDSRSLSFHAAPGELSAPQVLRIRNNAYDVLIDRIASPDGFLVARPDQEYGRDIDSFLIERIWEGTSINVRFSPEQAGGYSGTLVIHYSDGGTKHVLLRGWAYEGGTPVPAGPVSGIWSREESPYFVTGGIHVAKGAELKIEPGVKVFFTGPFGLTVGEGAKLTAEGSAAQPIEFTAWNKEAGWGGLRFVNSGYDDVLRYCTISYAKKGTGRVPGIFQPVSEADSTGGAIYCVLSDPTIDNCRILNNTGDMGGAIYCRRSSPLITNTLIANNTSGGGRSRSGGIHSDDSGVPEIWNCTIVNNFPGGIFSTSWDGLNVTNTIVWGNDRYQIQTDECSPTITFCCVQGGYPGEGNIDRSPAFLDPTAGAGAEYDAAGANWGLKSSSSCINAGTQILDLGPTDLAGGTRVYSGVIDIGAFENQSDLPLITASPSGTMDVGFAALDTSKTVVVELSNTGKLDFEIVDALIPPGDAFSIDAPVRSHPLAPGDSVQVKIRFEPTEEKVYRTTLIVRSTGSNGAPSLFVDLLGVGIAGTPVPAGTVSGTWRKTNSPYTVTGNIRVGRTQTLTIEPGVTVKFAGPFSLTVGYRATLRAVGTEQERILFTSLDRARGWGGIRFLNSAADDVLQFCTIEYARKSRKTGGGMLDLWGGAILCMGSWEEEPGMPIATSPTIDSCVIARNRAQTGGAIMCVEDSRAIITNNLIVDNYAEMDGGGIAMYGAECTVANNVIARNDALVGGGIMNWMSTPTIRNNTIVANKPSAMHLERMATFAWMPTPALIVNNIIWHNEIWLNERALPTEYTIRYNNIQGGWDGQGNINVDPLFADPANGDYGLKSQAGRWDPAAGAWVLDDVTSPCIDAGDPASSYAREPQPNGGRINLGACGGTERASKSPSAEDDP
jgi:hypothetical protein